MVGEGRFPPLPERGRTVRIANLILRLVGISRQVNIPEHNPAIPAATAELFSKAKSSIKIVSGGFSSRLYLDHKGIVDAIKQALKGECKVEIAVGPDAKEETLKFWDLHGASIFLLDQWPVQHFAVVDGKHVRLEDPHPAGEEKQVQYVVYNFKYADLLQKRFDALKKEARPWRSENTNA